jgi:hypothetical protein
MRMIRIALIVVVLAIVSLAATPAAHASKCGQYPTFIQPILCRL